MDPNMTHAPDARWEKFALFMILLLATGLRFWHLNDGLWYDEILTLTRFVRLPAEDLVATYGSLNNHILYTWLAKGCVLIYGETAWALRLPAVLFGLGSIALAWALIRDLGFRREALVVALLLSISFHHVWFSQNARGYTAILFFILAGALALRRALVTQAWHSWLLFGLTSAGALLVHLSSVFSLLGEGLVVVAIIIARKRRETDVSVWNLVKGPLLAVVVCALVTLAIFLPLIPDMLQAFHKVSAPAGVTKGSGDVKEWKNPIWTVVEIISSFGLLAFSIPFACLLLIWGAVRVVPKDPAVTGGLLLSIPITLAALLLAGMRIWPRYFFVDIAILLALVVIGAFALADTLTMVITRRIKQFPKSLFHIIGTCAMVAAFAWLLLPNYQHPKQDFQGAYDFVQSASAPGDRIITIGLAEVPYGQYLHTGWPSVTTLQALNREESASRQLWVIVAFPSHMRHKYPDMAQHMSTNYDKVKTFKGTLDGGDVVLWRSHVREGSRH